MHVTTLFKGKDIKLTTISGEKPIAIVTFNAFSDDKDPLEPIEFEVGFAQNIFARDGFTEYHIVTNKNNWFQSKEMDTVVKMIKEHYPHGEIFTYGCSMGGFGAINFSEKLGAKKFISLAPQFSIDPEETENDRRWSYENKVLDFRYNFIKNGSCHEAPGYVFFDGYSEDVIHARLIEENTSAILIDINFADHLLGDVINECYGLRRLVLEIASGVFDVHSFLAEFNERKKMNLSYLVKEANHYCRNGQIEKTKKILEKINTNESILRSQSLLSKHVETLLILGDIDGATKIIESSYQRYLNTSSPESYLYYAEKFREINRLDRSEKVIEEGLAIHNYGKLHYLRSVIHYNLYPGNLAPAIKSVKEAIDLTANSEYYYYLGELLSLDNQVDEAKKAYEEAISINDTIDYYYAKLSIAYLRNGDTDEAISSIYRAIKLNPENAHNYYLLGELLFFLGNMDSAQEAYQKAISLTDNPPEYYFTNLAKLNSSV